MGWWFVRSRNLSGIRTGWHTACREHKERYLPFLQEMADHGYLCIIHDHRGHGESVRQPEDLGYFYPDGGTAIVSDLYQVTRWIREQYPELPLYLFGHSMGSLVVRCYLKRYPDVPDGVFVCGSPSAVFGMGLGERVRALLARKRVHSITARFWQKHCSADSRNRFGKKADLTRGSVVTPPW